MKTTLLVLLFILHNSLLHAQSKAQTNLVFITYYPSWCQNALGTTYQDKSMGLPPEDINWSGITHVVHFGGSLPTASPPYTNITFDPVTGLANSVAALDYEYGADVWNGGTNCGRDVVPPTPCPNWKHWQADLISIAHAHGVKVLHDVQAIGLNEHRNLYNITLDQAKTDAFATAVVNYVNLRGYDGVEIDWEFFTDWNKVPSQAQTTRLTTAFRQKLGPNKILIYAPVFTNYNVYDPASDYMIDYYALQCYAYVSPWNGVLSSNSVWYDCPLHKGTVPAGFEGEAWSSRGPLNWVAVGHDPKKIVPGAYSGAYVYHNVDALFQAIGWTPAGEGDHKHADRLLNNGGTKVWDDARKVPYISGTALRTEGNTWYGQPGVSAGQKFFAVFEDSQSIKAKVDWVRANGLGGLMLYNFSSDIVDLRYGETPIAGKTNPVHRWIATALGSINFPTGSLTANPSTLQIGGGAVTLTWNSNNATGASIDQGIGSVNLSGSLDVNVTSTKTFTLTLTNSSGSSTYSVAAYVSLGIPIISGITTSNITPHYATIQWTTNAPSNSQVEYGTTTSYGKTTPADARLVSSHSMTLGSLTAGALYHYRVKSTEAAGHQAVSSDQTFTAAPPPTPSTIISDGFNSSNLNTSVWTFVNPLSDATLRIVHDKIRNGLLSIEVPGGKPHDVWTKGNKAPRIMQPSNDTDFEIELKFGSAVKEKYQIQGVIIEEDRQNFLRLDFHSDGSATRLFAASFVNGTPTPRANRVTAANGVVPLYMKVKRQGTLWTHSYSFDGKTWTVADSFTHALKVTKVGTFISNEGNPAPAFTGLIDYFFNTGSPSASNTNRTE
jgi:GH18 family chitinase